MSELLKCPFCGGEAEAAYAVYDYNRWGVYCKECGATVEAAEWNGRPDTEQEAITAWNTRVKPDGGEEK